MTPFRHFSNKGLRPQLSLQRGAFFLTVSSLLALHTGCGQSYETVETKTPTTGVITVLDETSEQQFSIAEERVVPAVEDSRIIVNYLDGRHDTLNVDQAKSLLSAADTTIYYGHNHAMGNVLWWGTMGYFMGRSMNSPVNPGVYRNQQTYQNNGTATSSVVRSSARTTYTQRPVSGRRGFFSSSSGGSGG
jgi:hypothetical protein